VSHSASLPVNQIIDPCRGDAFRRHQPYFETGLYQYETVSIQWRMDGPFSETGYASFGQESVEPQVLEPVIEA
jgi:hypothetical protein